MHLSLRTLVLLLSIDLTISLGIDGVRSICSDTDNFCSDLVCSYENISLTLKIETLNEKGIDYKRIHLRDRTCTGFNSDDKYVYVAWPLGRDVCGTGLTLDDKYGTYENQVFFPPTGIIYRELFVLNVSCSYPLDYNVSLPQIVWPDVSISYIHIEGIGKFKVKMALYEDIAYKNQYTQSPVQISTKSFLYVKVYIEDPIADYNLLMVECFSTPTSNFYQSTRYDIIKNSCPNQQDKTIVVLENGVTTEGKFYIQAFKFIGDYSSVYLHCQIHLCSNPPGCAPTCSSGSNRAAYSVPEVQATLSLGPIRILAESDKTEPDDADSGVGTASSFSVITMIGLAIMNRIFL